MEHLTCIMVGVDVEPAGRDISSGSMRAIEQALWITERSGARLVLLHSTAHDRYLDPIGMNTVIVGEGPREEVLDGLLELVERAGEQDIDCELVLDDRPAGDALVDRAVRSGADLILVGKRSEAERDGRRLGRVSKKLLRTSSVPVWVASADHIGPVKTIVAATDLSAVGNGAARNAAGLARLFEADLHVVHAVPLEFLPPANFPGEDVIAHADVEQSVRISGAKKRLDELCGEMPVEAHAHVLDRPPYDAVRDFAKEHEADLVVLGTASRHGLAGFLVGNTAEWLLDSIDASLLAFPPTRS